MPLDHMLAVKNTSVSASANVPGWQSWKTLLSVTAYHSFGRKWRLRTPLRYAASTLDAVTNFRQ
jgi:hypothetical protein